MIRPGRLWWQFRRDLRRGWNASRNYYKLLPLIARWHWPFWNERTKDIPIHVLTGAEDWQLAAWMLASFFVYTGEAWPIVVHEDGTVPEAARQAFAAMFPQVRFIGRPEADTAMAAALKPFPHCAEYRASHPLALKIFDVPHFTAGERFIILDSDILFFRRPREILAWAAAGNDECWFNEDVAESALITAKEAFDELHVQLWPRVNSGLCLLHKSALDLAFCDEALARTTILRGKIWRVEQTLFALCASRHGKGGLLPKTYEVSLGKAASPDAISRHYVGAVRDHFYGEGLPRVASAIFNSDE